MGVPWAPGVTRGGGCAGCPGFGFPLVLPRVAAAPPRLPQGPGVPVRGTSLASAAAARAMAAIPAFGIIPSLPAWPRGSLGFPCQNTPNPSSAPGVGGSWAIPSFLSDHKFWASPALLSSRIPGVWGGGCQYFPGAGLGGLLVPPSPSQNTRDCLWSVEPHRRVCTLQILQQNIF